MVQCAWHSLHPRQWQMSARNGVLIDTFVSMRLEQLEVASWVEGLGLGWVGVGADEELLNSG